MRAFGDDKNTKIRDWADGSSNCVAMSEQTRDKYNGALGGWSYVCHVNMGIDFAGPLYDPANNIHWPWTTINMWDYYGKRRDVQIWPIRPVVFAWQRPFWRLPCRDGRRRRPVRQPNDC